MTAAVQPTPRQRTKPARWSHSEGDYGNTVRVFEERNGRLYGQIRGVRKMLDFDNSGVGALNTKENRKRAKTWAKDQEKELREGRSTAADPAATTAKVFAAHAAAQIDADKSKASRYEDKRCAEMWTRWLGADRDLSKLTLGEWQGFIRARQLGSIDAWGRAVPEPQKPEDPKRRPVRDRTVEADCEWLLKVCNWATEWDVRETGRVLLREHPLRRERFRDAVPHEQNPRRPVATQDRFEAVLAVADRVKMDVRRDGKRIAVRSYLREILELVNGTARRISAVCTLRYEDLRLAKTAAAPHGAIAWPGQTDKMGKAWTAPINAAVRAVLDAILSERPGIGAAYLFPLPSNLAKPVNRYVVSDWLLKAEKLAELPKQDGTLWHAYRRKWGTERKHLPIQDVAQAGGWKNAATLQTIYQQPDDATLYAVVSQPAELREAKA